MKVRVVFVLWYLALVVFLYDQIISISWADYCVLFMWFSVICLFLLGFLAWFLLRSGEGGTREILFIVFGIFTLTVLEGFFKKTQVISGDYDLSLLGIISVLVLSRILYQAKKKKLTQSS